MTISKLIKLLEALNPDAQVILQCDPEGNGYSPIANNGVSAAIYVDGEVIFDSWSADDWLGDAKALESLRADPANAAVVLAPKY